MPLYFFDFDDDSRPSSPDTMGTELASLACIPEEAIAVLASNAKDRLPDGSHRVFSASVRNDQGVVVFTASLTLQSKWAWQLQDALIEAILEDRGSAALSALWWEDHRILSASGGGPVQPPFQLFPVDTPSLIWRGSVGIVRLKLHFRFWFKDRTFASALPKLNVLAVNKLFCLLDRLGIVGAPRCRHFGSLSPTMNH
jgi:hypothetical protein